MPVLLENLTRANPLLQTIPGSRRAQLRGGDFILSLLSHARHERTTITAAALICRHLAELLIDLVSGGKETLTVGCARLSNCRRLRAEGESR